MKEISDELYQELEYLGIIDNSGVRNHNVGKSNYHTKLISPWVVWLSYPELTEFDKDIIKRTLRTKEGDSRKMDYEKIIHICQERIRQIDVMEKQKEEEYLLPTKGDEYLCVKDFSIDNGDSLSELFTKHFYYTSSSDGFITGNNGFPIRIDANGVKKHFRKVNK